MALPRSVLLIISGSVSAYKSLELVRLLKAEGIEVTAILTRGGAKFVTPLAISSLTGTRTYDDLFSLTDEVEMGHIQLSRVAELVLVAPASADLLAKMACGIADDLATTALLATDKPVVVAPAMNHRMWHHPATQRNLAQLRADGIAVIEPTDGSMACGEHGIGRLAEPKEIVAFLERCPLPAPRDAENGHRETRNGLAGKRAIVTSGPTHEPIDPVRFLGNRSSGKQGHAIATALAQAGAEVTLVSGPTQLADPAGVRVIRVTTGQEMLRAAQSALPADIFVGAAAVADWRPSQVAAQKIKKQNKLDTLQLEFLPTDDILATLAQDAQRPALMIGFAAETEQLQANAQAKRRAKGADWILANDVSQNIFGSDENEILLITDAGEEAWPRMDKSQVAAKLIAAITTHFDTSQKNAAKPTLVKTRKG